MKTGHLLKAERQTRRLEILRHVARTFLSASSEWRSGHHSHGPFLFAAGFMPPPHKDAMAGRVFRAYGLQDSNSALVLFPVC
jgi:hypothetical protein